MSFFISRPAPTPPWKRRAELPDSLERDDSPGLISDHVAPELGAREELVRSVGGAYGNDCSDLLHHSHVQDLRHRF
jgi:hypothetical protein